ncbi:MAG: cytochrome c biogenesis protein CcsA [Deltaproteobacteria bacterium]|nr:cytochrome c biogenesis protein CcsA [Deltaproteobacteria bacterium]
MKKPTPQKNLFAAVAPLALLGALLMAGCHWMIFAYAPEERVMGLIQKVFYLHMPLAWWALFSFFLVFVCGIAYLARRTPFWDALAESAAEIGLLMAGLALITGSIWARVSWNTWWTWDPRLSTTLIMWFIYAGYLVVRRLDFTFERRATVSAALGIIAFIDVPLVFFSARLWPQTMHPSVVGRSGGLEGEMLTTLFVCLAAMGVFWVALLLTRYRQALAAQRLDRARLDYLNNEDNF